MSYAATPKIPWVGQSVYCPSHSSRRSSIVEFPGSLSKVSLTNFFCVSAIKSSNDSGKNLQSFKVSPGISKGTSSEILAGFFFRDSDNILIVVFFYIFYLDASYNFFKKNLL